MNFMYAATNNFIKIVVLEKYPHWFNNSLIQFMTVEIKLVQLQL